MATSEHMPVGKKNVKKEKGVGTKNKRMATFSSLSLIIGRRRTTEIPINQTKGDALVQNGNATHMQKGTRTNPTKDIKK